METQTSAEGNNCHAKNRFERKESLKVLNYPCLEFGHACATSLTSEES